ncbi:uncharacterized protein A4U43_C06F18080 [Asparagus officinalis]|uniref:RRM domain-containing protein n=1 Tax=Asparagus officinalis TaxID=4686 RepID=A0A5P1ER12_ASPOF|nr:uncharacterized protein A4U43_C06F18080 [Asparagus officinalis]
MLEKVILKYGRIVDIELKNPPPPGYCFVEFESARDADDAVRGCDGYNFDGYRLRRCIKTVGTEEAPSKACLGSDYDSEDGLPPLEENLNHLKLEDSEESEEEDE